MRALISVHDKTGLADFARTLAEAGVELLSTGGTARHLREAGLAVRDVADVTGAPEMLDGRVKTLHPAVHGGILARRDRPEHLAQLEAHGMAPIDLVVVNLYSFRETAADPRATPEDVIEQIDIGGVALLRAAAKNFAAVAVVCDPSDYAAVAASVRHGGAVPEPLRRQLAAKAFRHTADYDAAIAGWFHSGAGTESGATEGGAAPFLELRWPLATSLRYGENPHQAAALYRDPQCRETNLAAARQLQGKELSYNNILDGDGALETARDFLDFPEPVVVIVKHGNPCGIARGATVLEAYRRALECDPVSAFGGIIAITQGVDGDAAAEMAELFLEVVIAPSFTDAAREAFAKKKNLRLLETGAFTPKMPARQLRSITGGLLAMDRDLGHVTAQQLRAVTKAKPSEEDLAALLFSWRCAKWVKSNAIVYTDGMATVGIGAGQMSRVDSARFGAEKARKPLAGGYLASDAFFPFRDGIDAAAAHGVKAVIQPGGSMRDDEVIAAADEHGMVMVFTGMRHFRH
ncbi:MAG: bifunctional phosphoribosylaminoimidazolecarboxamide formyltransferase/IMP cyclohydrolase [Candidatus Sumerlaeia bacterium]|nr:bifunctional phosphoribosylaminoimidazolecarboxamide formyltransferase/IMP cyclohydrolase [Candidatus Sumerlaeia bacterium]